MALCAWVWGWVRVSNRMPTPSVSTPFFGEGAWNDKPEWPPKALKNVSHAKMTPFSKWPFEGHKSPNGSHLWGGVICYIFLSILKPFFLVFWGIMGAWLLWIVNKRLDWHRLPGDTPETVLPPLTNLVRLGGGWIALMVVPGLVPRWANVRCLQKKQQKNEMIHYFPKPRTNALWSPGERQLTQKKNDILNGWWTVLSSDWSPGRGEGTDPERETTSGGGWSLIKSKKIW